ncbi:unnamed protein product [Arabidopsis arenosa]|uniref:Zinc finger PHD-type domain-containing protein n=1 Tax=Arabidopsis arenosa TaxID=38785 RepID=A0A8S2A9X8_ARAAE|nr:unnamed protein product [Arabidopsis arenosa]
MDLRLLHGVAYGRPWFGKWDYMFSHGSFGVRKDQYWRAILTLSSIEVDNIIEDFSGTSKGRVMKTIIDFYRGSSETPLATLSDLLRFMLGFRSKAPIQTKTAMALVAMSLDSGSYPILRADENTEVCTSPHQESDDNGYESGRDTVLDDHNTTVAGIKTPQYYSFDDLGRREHSRWPGRRLNEAAQAVLKVFKEQKSTITRQELREAVRISIGDTGLIDFLLKHIDKVLIGDQIVQRFTSQKSRMLQFSLRTINSCVQEQERKKKRKLKPQEINEWTSTTPGLSPYDDILYLYKNLLLTYPDSDIYSEASQVILNCKSFIKEWSYQEPNPLTVSCQVLPSHEELLRDVTRLLPPGELVVLEIRNRFLEKLDDNLGLKSQGNTEFLVKGFGLDIGTELRYEGGFDDWTVDCKCGARDDDGERMVACDSCKVWHHTLCNSIEDDEVVPSVFLCNRCYGDSLRSKKCNLSIR